jgi:methylated-DNA-protein-cysteine methyltransferase-like protein
VDQLAKEGLVDQPNLSKILKGEPRGARQVGMVLWGLDSGDDVPWQRVINSQGGISTYKVGSGEMQKALLQAEGIKVSAAGKIDLKRYQWHPVGETEKAQAGLFDQEC